jgi:glycosyltransferase involved in cell wall biosynthesis
VQALRFHSAAYVHGHQVGGTNPSLVEALGAGNPVIAHDNRFNRWVAGGGASYFTCADTFSQRLGQLLANPEGLANLRTRGQERFDAMFTWSGILNQYQRLLERHLPS